MKFDIDEVLAHEELLWFQKSREDWLTQGDRNTSYFYSRTLNRRKRNKISGLVIDFEWCFDEERLQLHMREFFKDLYFMEYRVSGSFSCARTFSRLKNDDVSGLGISVTDAKVRKVVFGMASLKASRIDGF